MLGGPLKILCKSTTFMVINKFCFVFQALLSKGITIYVTNKYTDDANIIHTLSLHGCVRFLHIALKSVSLLQGVLINNIVTYSIYMRFKHELIINNKILDDFWYIINDEQKGISLSLCNMSSSSIFEESINDQLEKQIFAYLDLRYQTFNFCRLAWISVEQKFEYKNIYSVDLGLVENVNNCSQKNVNILFT
ncbi:hypothetical protein BpHYR1_040783 [Brachionus plicatilis]|uniref:Uncharacterized protein n=1 Tax=Brachionus plicatilis TaxID=10195 RepID=A0A3M7Q2F7_BRAPC|nr:hypothetical protein BpHYR1_040783 [Brachionus plicatilis]